jgi:hypothetical protein
VTLGEALALAPVMHARSEASREVCLAASVVCGPAVVLGAGQRAGRVLQLDACAAAGTVVYRRLTSGTAAYVGARAIVWTLALPHVAALVPDATPRTLLNRNVRAFLDGLRRAGGGLAHYLGREWISVGRRPAALLGFEVSAAHDGGSAPKPPSGAVIIEVIAGVDAPLALPEALATAEERAIDRWLGKTPAALGEVMAGDALTIAGDVMKTVARRAATPIDGPPSGPVTSLPPLTSESSPMPPGFVAGPGIPVPIGWIDTGIHPTTREAWLGGDALVPAYVYRGVARGDLKPGEVPMEGASLADLHEAVRAVRATSS